MVTATTPAWAQDTTMRVGTYNTRWICDTLGASDYFTNAERVQFAQELCWRIFRSNYDVIALQETFDADAAYALGQCLQNVYPYQVVYAANNNSDSPNGSANGTGCDSALSSGLSIFSKHPFEPLTSTMKTTTGTWTEIDGDQRRYGWNLYSKGIMRLGSTSVVTNQTTVKNYLGYEEFTDVDQGICDSGNIGGFVDFLDGDEDCLSDKGVAFVRVKHAVTGRISNVFFTHLFSAGGATARESNLRAFSRLLALWGFDLLTVMNTQETYLVGDFNINGADQSATSEWSRLMSPETATGSIGVLNQGFRDAWHFEGFGRDRGVTTHARSQRRLDYILRNTPAYAGVLCNSHMSRAFNLNLDNNLGWEPFAGGLSDQFASWAAPGGTWGDPGLAGPFNFSDHLGLNAELQACHPYSTPLAPSQARATYGNDLYGYRTIKGETDGGTYDNTNKWIQASLTINPGRAMWSKIHESGWYVLGLWDGGVSRNGKIEVYREDDWSRPQRSYKGQVFRGTLNGSNYSGHYFLLTGSKPYYVKTRFKAPSETGDVWWTAKKLDCSNFYNGNVCPLEPNRVNGVISMPSNVAYGEAQTDLAVFVVDVPGLHSGKAQRVKLGITGWITDTQHTQVGVYEQQANGTLVWLGYTTNNPPIGRASPSGTCPYGSRCHFFEWDVVGPKRYILVAQRADRTKFQKFIPFWSTNAVSMFGARRSPDLPPGDQTDSREILLQGVDASQGNDELSIRRLSIDSSQGGANIIDTTARNLPYNAAFEGDSPGIGAASELYSLDGIWHLYGIHRRFFTDNVTIRWMEYDDWGDDFATITIPASEMTSADQFLARGQNIHNDQVSLRRTKDFQLDGDLGSNSEFRLQYNLGRPWAADCYSQDVFFCNPQGWEFNPAVLFP